MQIPKPIPLTISHLRTRAKPVKTKIAAHIKKKPAIKNILAISDNPLLLPVLYSNWVSTTAANKARLGNVTTSMEILREPVIFLRGRKIHAKTPAAITAGIIAIMLILPICVIYYLLFKMQQYFYIVFKNLFFLSSRDVPIIDGVQSFDFVAKGEISTE